MSTLTPSPANHQHRLWEILWHLAEPVGTIVESYTVWRWLIEVNFLVEGRPLIGYETVAKDLNHLCEGGWVALGSVRSNTVYGASRTPSPPAVYGC